MIHIGADVHVRNTVLRAKDSEGEVLASTRRGGALFDRDRRSVRHVDLGEYGDRLDRLEGHFC